MLKDDGTGKKTEIYILFMSSVVLNNLDTPVVGLGVPEFKRLNP